MLINNKLRYIDIVFGGEKMFYFVKDIEENVMNVNCLKEVPFLEESIYNMSLNKMIKEYENIKKWFMINKMAKNFQIQGVAGKELEFLSIESVPNEEMDYTHDILHNRIKQKMGSEFDDYEHDSKLRLSRTCSRILFHTKLKSILEEWM